MNPYHVPELTIVPLNDGSGRFHFRGRLFGIQIHDSNYDKMHRPLQIIDAEAQSARAAQLPSASQLAAATPLVKLPSAAAQPSTTIDLKLSIPFSIEDQNNLALQNPSVSDADKDDILKRVQKSNPNFTIDQIKARLQYQRDELQKASARNTTFSTATAAQPPAPPIAAGGAGEPTPPAAATLLAATPPAALTPPLEAEKAAAAEAAKQQRIQREQAAAAEKAAEIENMKLLRKKFLETDTGNSLLNAIKRGDTKQALQLIKTKKELIDSVNNSQLYNKTPQNISALQLACFLNQEDVAVALIEAGANVYRRSGKNSLGPSVGMICGDRMPKVSEALAKKGPKLKYAWGKTRKNRR